MYTFFKAGLLQLELQQATAKLLSTERCESIYGNDIDIHKQLCSVELGQNLGPCVVKILEFFFL
jgi:hypothetical protein